VAGYRFHASSKTVAEGEKFEAEWDRIRDRFVPTLPLHQLIVARHRLAMRRSTTRYTQAAREQAAGQRAAARATFASAFANYPPSLLGRSGLGCVRRLFLGGA
jgi:hypothetical protein